MNQVIDHDERAAGIDHSSEDEVSAPPWTAQQAQAWRSKNPPLSPWRVVAVQAVAGLVCWLIVWGVTRRSEAGWSALYGAAAVVVPSVLLARGMTRKLANAPGAVGAAVFRFMFWEMVKIGVAVAMLIAAPRVIESLSWPALLVAMIVCMKVNWLALSWQRRTGDATTSRV